MKIKRNYLLVDFQILFITIKYMKDEYNKWEREKFGWLSQEI